MERAGWAEYGGTGTDKSAFAALVIGLANLQTWLQIGSYPIMQSLLTEKQCVG